MARKNKYTDEELLNILRDYYKKHNEYPSAKKIKQGKTIAKRFGNWNNALMKAGIKYRYSDNELLSKIKKYHKKNNKVPTEKDLKNISTSIIKRFGSWNNALKKAGVTTFKRDKNSTKYSKNEMIKIYKKLYINNGYKKIKVNDLKKMSKENELIPTPNTLMYTFKKKMSEIWDIVEIEANKITEKSIKQSRIKKVKRYTDEELLNIIKDYYAKNNKIPELKNLNEEFNYIGDIIRKRFNSWNKALYLAGVISEKRDKNKRYSDKELLDIIKDYYDKNNKIPSFKDLINIGSTATTRFGSWNNALEKAGLKATNKHYNKDELIEMLLKIYIKHMRRLTIEELEKELKDMKLPRANTFRRKLGVSFNEIWDIIENEIWNI